MDRVKILVDGGGHGYSIALFPNVEVKEPLYEKVKRLKKENKQLKMKLRELRSANQKDT
ncbi:MAG: hypothetical protein ACXQTW_01790 [Candidatus Methanospirareceae archaeon]